jgi:hypothetical protein
MIDTAKCPLTQERSVGTLVSKSVLSCGRVAATLADNTNLVSLSITTELHPSTSATGTRPNVATSLSALPRNAQVGLAEDIWWLGQWRILLLRYVLVLVPETLEV